jgi:hypothetical protein
MKQWHKITLTFDGPESSEQASDNLFMNYRMVVTFSNGNQTFVVPGYFAADGDAANSGAIAGNQWRCHFVTSETGKWTWSTSFRNGFNIAVNDLAMAGKACSFDGETGFFNVGPSDKTAPDFRAKGTLQYTGGHYLQFTDIKKCFLKGGADSPENFLAFEEIDDTYDADAGSGSYSHISDFIHLYKPHIRDWRPGDPIWQKSKGKGIIGAISRGISLVPVGNQDVLIISRDTVVFCALSALWSKSAQIKGGRSQNRRTTSQACSVIEPNLLIGAGGD